MTTPAPPDLNRLFAVAGKHVLITGGTGGLGSMLAATYLAAGARVWITGRKPEALAQSVAELSALGPVQGLEGDLATMEGTRAIIEAFQAQADRLHVLVNNAGQTWGAPLERFPERGWDSVMDVNVRAPFFLAQGLLPQLQATASDEDPARVINIGSIYGEATEVQYAYSYTASKAAIHQLTRVMARELAPRRVLVNAIAPGLFHTKMTHFAMKHDEMRANLLQGIPLNRAGTIEDIGGLALFLSSRAGAYMTGNIIPLDGGILAAH
jgi:NAD(P)-dependent dehydrogenase (short-subunit alcohol dehydrogenase family)